MEPGDIKNLYFIAIIPHDELRKEVRLLKEEFRDNFNSKHALKSPAHITLIPPFKREALHERFISDALRRFAHHQHKFTVNLKGFNNFSPRVIYIDVSNPQEIITLYQKLREYLLDQMLFHQDELKSKMHPHMTLATRDLTREDFHKAWQLIKNRPFNAKFDVSSVYLLIHNGKFWDIKSEFSFLSNEQ